MSTFDEREPFKKRVVTASLTGEQRQEFDQIKTALGITSDGALIKRALADLSRTVLVDGGRADVDHSVQAIGAEDQFAVHQRDREARCDDWKQHPLMDRCRCGYRRTPNHTNGSTP
ncbi:hypothetical protein [Microbacterium sp. 22296]|uniref:hypothetical protein n=1 Tax=Microbacterium sp. 22296 TaxID=3453903 RepID=UPI003F82E4B0